MRGKLFIGSIIFLVVLSAFIAVFAGVFYFTEVNEERNIAVMSQKVENTVSKSSDTTKEQATPVPENTAVPDSTPMPESTQTPENSENNEDLKIVAVGDILLGRSVKLRAEKQPTRYIYPFEKSAEILKQGDIVFANLEESITSSQKGLTPIDKGGKYVLKNEPEAIEGIKYAGFNLFSLANNHILDYYEKGLLDTIDVLDKNGIVHAGAGKNLDEARQLKIIEKKGQKIGLLAYTDMAWVTYKGNPPLSFIATKEKSGVAPTQLDYIKEDIEKARSEVDILIVSLHWGIEYTYEPTAKQIDLAHQIIDSGADMILGHHTHRFQSIEIYKDKPIFYSLGNFIFDQNNPENQQGFIMEMSIRDKNLVGLKGIPFKIVNKSQVVPQSKASAAEMIKRQIKLNDKLGTKSKLENDTIVFELNN